MTLRTVSRLSLEKCLGFMVTQMKKCFETLNHSFTAVDVLTANFFGQIWLQAFGFTDN